MSKTKVIYLVSGSRHTVPPNQKSPGVPRIIETLSANDTIAATYKVVSKYDCSLQFQDYNKGKYLHIKPTLWNRFFESLLSYTPQRFRKYVFGYTLVDRIVYYEGIRRLIKKDKPDIVITFMHFALFKKLCLAYPKAKHVYFFRSTDLKYRLGTDNIEFLVNNSSGFLANTKSPIIELQTLMSNCDFPKETIYNSIKLTDFTDKISSECSKCYRQSLGLTERDFIIGYAGRLSEEKSILELLEAILHLKNSGCIVHLLIAGSIANESTPNTAYYNEIMSFVKLNIRSQVHFLGWLPNQKLYKFYNALDIGVLLSKYSEGNSMFLLEALSMGKPVIATSIGGNLEIIIDEKNGFLIEIKEVTAQLVIKIEKIIKNKVQLKNMSENALNYIKQNHTNYVMVDKFNNFIKKL
ncbi:MAG: glycosyltransferase family 4 protein [Winogradskyella sp.]|uniref:glycosyltransferase family 4 protein n=1 Tax=Winogradskyella sp. TaxID=1883156 RepID=UPI00385CB335